MDYGEILKKSWNITWKFKVLWLFGFLASCGKGGGGGGGGAVEVEMEGHQTGPVLRAASTPRVLTNSLSRRDNFLGVFLPGYGY